MRCELAEPPGVRAEPVLLRSDRVVHIGMKTTKRILSVRLGDKDRIFRVTLFDNFTAAPATGSPAVSVTTPQTARLRALAGNEEHSNRASSNPILLMTYPVVGYAPGDARDSRRSSGGTSSFDIRRSKATATAP